MPPIWGAPAGGNIAETAAIDRSGIIVVAGETHSVDFPVTADAFQTQANRWVGDDGFVSKVSPQGDLLHSTFFGAESVVPSTEYIRGVAVDSGGAIYLVGDTTDPSMPTTSGAYRPTGCGGLSDAFVSKLSRSGTLVWSTYLCGADYDRGSAIAVDAAGNVVVAGTTGSTDFPETDPATGLTGLSDAWVAKLEPSGSSLIYSRLVGGSDSDSATAVAVRPNGAAVAAGRTLSEDLPVLNAAQPSYGGGEPECYAGICGDAFVFELDPAGRLTRCTYLGGRTDESVAGVAIDARGTVHVAGSTESSDFPTLDPVVPRGGGQDAFVVSYGQDGTVVFATTLGGADIDRAGGIAARGDTLFVSGTTLSDGFPVAAAFQSMKRPGDNFDAFLTLIRLDSASTPRRARGRYR